MWPAWADEGDTLLASISEHEYPNEECLIDFKARMAGFPAAPRQENKTQTIGSKETFATFSANVRRKLWQPPALRHHRPLADLLGIACRYDAASPNRGLLRLAPNAN